MNLSLFRQYQNEQIAIFASQLCVKKVIEWGGVKSEDHSRFFSGFAEFEFTSYNAISAERKEDLTRLSHPDNSVEAAICISVLQHVFELDKAIDEIIRVLKPGGQCLITNGYFFPICMEDDYYRLTPAFWEKRLENEPVEMTINPLGNTYDALDNLLMRPYGKYVGLRSLIHKSLSLPFKLLRFIRKMPDNAPLGVAVVIKKKMDTGCYEWLRND